jgi:copper transport protein
MQKHNETPLQARRPSPLAGRLCLSALVLTILWLLWPGRTVQAHANLVRAEPAPDSVQDEPPDRVTIWFTEPIEGDFSEIQVLDTAGQRVDSGDSQVDGTDATVLSVTLPPLPEGTYTVAWKNLSSVDGHTVRGSFIFGVGDVVLGATDSRATVEQPLLPAPAEPVLRWLALLGLMTLIGGLAFRQLVIRPALQQESQAIQALEQRLTARITRWLWIATAVFLLASIGHVVLQTTLIQEVSPVEALGWPLVDVLTQTGWGMLWLWRMGLFLLLAVALRLTTTTNAAWREQRAWLALAAGLGVAMTISLSSHAAATEEVRTAATFSDFLHLLAASFWVGGLFHFALGMPLILKTLSGAERGQFLAAVVPNFSSLATLSVGTLIVTGLYGAYAQVTTVPALQTPYGRTLLVKLALVVPLLILGAINLLWLSRRLAVEESAATRLHRSLTGEAILSLFVLLAAALLITLEPARQVASRQGLGTPDALTFEDTVEGANIHLAIEPGRVGENQFTVTLQDRRGDPIEDADDIILQVVFLDADLSPLSARVTNEGQGRYTFDEVLLSIAGRWQAELTVIRPDAFDARTAFRFEALPAVGSNSAAISPSAQAGNLLWGLELVLLGFLFLGVSIPLGSWYERRGRAILVPGMICVVVGLVLIGVVQSGSGPEGNQGNPFPPTQNSIEMGQAVFIENCQSCHGREGRGDGPNSAGLEPPPANLHEHVPLHPDMELFAIVTNGISGTAMPAFEGQLSEEERWHLINYMRALVAED